MRTLATWGTRIAIVLAGVMSLVTQVFIIPLMSYEVVREFPEFAYLQPLGIVGCLVIVLCFQVMLVCLWMLVTLTSRGRVFSPIAFRYVDVMTAASAAIAVLSLVAFAILAPQGAINPGVMILVFLGTVAGLGAAALLMVMRGLLHQATTMRAEWDEVV